MLAIQIFAIIFSIGKPEIFNTDQGVQFTGFTIH